MGHSPESVALPGIPDDLARDIDHRIREFEERHEAAVLADGPGWVPRIRGIDYAAAIAVNVVIVVWLVVALTGGGNG
ncbi:MAG TPA: hypothetical protein VM307_05715 [Egibacteraceae bacterium]|nr:hypothetical protein [Egibacteraceae bacterium]